MTGGVAYCELPCRKSICLSQPVADTVIHYGDQAFPQELGKLYKKHESQLLSDLVDFKNALRTLYKDDFFSFFSERLADILGAQMSFVSKRMLVDEQDRAVEMPPIGESGSCLMASALYYNDGRGTSNTLKAFKYHAYGCPCGYMRFDKVFIIPEKLAAFVPNNPNDLPFVCESYIGVPLFADGKCIAHFGVMWSKEGMAQRQLSWAMVELFLHSLEDVVLARLLEGTKFSTTEDQSMEKNRIIPHSAVTAAQSLKPYARSLSHELRTPMQGVVGMLDVMYATVLEASEGQTNAQARQVFETLRENIEMVQDSSRRAVEAADNVVHAYDMDMHLPDVQHSMITGDTLSSPGNALKPDNIHQSPFALLPSERPTKRRRGEDGHAVSVKEAVNQSEDYWSLPSEELKIDVEEAEQVRERNDAYNSTRLSSPLGIVERNVAPGLRHTQLRNVLLYVINEGLKVGGRPESVIATETENGEIIEVQNRSSTGEIQRQVIEWSVDPAVPISIFVDEKDLGKLISCVFLNAIKFAEQGKITVHARMSAMSRNITVSVSDSGPGIPKAFLPRLFRPFSQEDPSLTRQREGLGLGLLVAKGIARKLGGDLMCTRADTDTSDHGCTFEIRFPSSPADHISRPSSPCGSPAARSSRFSVKGEEPTNDGRLRSDSPARSQSDECHRDVHAEQITPWSVNGSAKRKACTLRPAVVDKLGKHLLPDQHNPIHGCWDSNCRPPITTRKSSANTKDIDRDLASKYPLAFLVAEDNKINRKLLVNMLAKFGYNKIYEAHDGTEAVRQMEKHRDVDVILMDLWMPLMDGYEATEKILDLDFINDGSVMPPTILAVTADVTGGALDKATKVGMSGFLSKPFKLLDLQRLIMEYCSHKSVEIPLIVPQF